LRRLLTGTSICERTLWESLAVRDQLRRDVPTTRRGWPRSGVEAATWPGGRAAACMTGASELIRPETARFRGTSSYSTAVLVWSTARRLS
jgi:hypothetical protein